MKTGTRDLVGGAHKQELGLWSVSMKTGARALVGGAYKQELGLCSVGYENRS